MIARFFRALMPAFSSRLAFFPLPSGERVRVRGSPLIPAFSPLGGEGGKKGCPGLLPQQKERAKRNRERVRNAFSSLPLILTFSPFGGEGTNRTGERVRNIFSPLPWGERVRVRRGVLFLLAILGLLLGGCLPKNVQPTSGVFAVIRAEPREGQAPLTVHFDATRSTDPAGPITDYLWDFGDGSPVASGPQISHTFRRAGEYLVTLVVVGPSGTGRATTLIRALNNPPKASFTVWPKDPFTDESVTFDASASSDPDGDPLSYRWDFGDGSTAEGKIVQHTYKKAGEYVVILTVSDPAGAESRATVLLKVEECVGGGCGRR